MFKKYFRVLTVISAVLFLFTPSWANDNDNGVGLGPLTPQITAEWWQWALSIWKFSTPGAAPDETQIHPLRTEVGTAPGEIDPSSADCMIGQHGPVWFLGGSFFQVDLSPDTLAGGNVQSQTRLEPLAENGPPVPDIVRTCTIPLGKAILMPVINGECNTAEEIYLGNLTGNEPLEERIDFVRSCARTQADGIQNVEASFGRTEGPLRSLNVRRVATPLSFSMTYPTDHLLQFEENWQPTVNPSLAFADGYWVVVKPSQPGQYELNTFGEVPAFDFSLRIKYILTIVGPEDQ